MGLHHKRQAEEESEILRLDAATHTTSRSTGGQDEYDDVQSGKAREYIATLFTSQIRTFVHALRQLEE
jgi:hypothetical protein